jgi:hypothetical protein
MILYARLESKSVDIEMDIGCGVSPFCDVSSDSSPFGTSSELASFLVESCFPSVLASFDGRLVNCDAANSMTFIASLTVASSGSPLAFSTLSPNSCAFLTNAALSAEKIVQSFSQKLFSFLLFVVAFGADLLVDLAADFDADCDASFAAVLAGRHWRLSGECVRDNVLGCRDGEAHAKVYFRLP